MNKEWVTGNWNPIFEKAVKHFDCQMSASGSTSRGIEGKRRARKQSQIHSTINRFRNLMSGPNPPQTKQQAVKALSPFLAFLLSAFVRSVIEWLWDQMQEPVTVTTSGDSQQ
jgi:hypothetical protein